LSITTKLFKVGLILSFYLLSHVSPKLKLYFRDKHYKITEMFCFIDNSCEENQVFYATHLLPTGFEAQHLAGWKTVFSESTKLPFLVLCHLSGC